MAKKTNRLSVLFRALRQLFMAATLAAAAGALVYFASTRTLPFLSKAEQDYSIVEETSPGQDQSENPGSESGETSGENSGVTPPGFDMSAYLGEFDKIIPGGVMKVSEDRFDKAGQKLVLFGNNPFSQTQNAAEIQVRMGFVFAGEKIFTSMLVDVTERLSDYEFAGDRDLAGNPLFKKGSAYYYLDSSLNVREAAFSPNTDGRKLDFDVPVYLGIQDGNIKRMYNKTYPENQKYGYYGNSLVYANYCVETFAFGGGRGVAIRNRNGIPTLEVYSDFFYTSGGNLVATGFYPPGERGLFSIGFFYYDDGYTRARVKRPDLGYDEVLIDRDGSILPLLDDFSLVSYSDGILLVKSKITGEYGYMTNRLNWITDPVFEEARPFLEGLAAVKVRGGGYGVIDTSGDFALKPVFDYVSDCSGGVIACYSKSAGINIFVKIYP
ncbi:MAG: WG repeat-containing protein [Eubacteriales bacterium]